MPKLVYSQCNICLSENKMDAISLGFLSVTWLTVFGLYSWDMQ